MTKPRNRGDGLDNEDEIEEINWVMGVRSWRWICNGGEIMEMD